MKTNGQFRSLIAAVAMVSTGALAQSTATPPSPPTPKMMGDAAMTRADSEYRAAQTACSAQPVAMRDQCLRDAKAKYDRAREMNGKNSKDGGNDSSGAGAESTRPCTREFSQSSSDHSNARSLSSKARKSESNFVPSLARM